MQVDEAGGDDEAGGVDALRLDDHLPLAGADPRHAPVDDHDVGDPVPAERRVDHAAVVDGERRHAPASASSGPPRPESR